MPRRTAISMLFAMVASAALATEAPPPPPPLTLHKTAAPIVIDGDLSDAGWQDAVKIDQFVEGSPGDNTPAKIKTVAYLTYDDRFFYIGIRSEDPDPKRIRAPYVERDNVIGTDDNIAVFLDTRNDKRTAMELRVNPRGIQGDGIYNDANGNEDFSPDYFYDTAAKIDAGGWSAEYRIPFSSLRYPHVDSQTWNILIWRNYPREFRYAFYSGPVPRGSNCLVCHAHPIILTNLPDSGHLVAAPYVTSQQVSTPVGDLGTPLDHRDLHSDTGVDVKWNPSATGAIDLTLNPDFSQIEADVPQITVNQRFAVFFPEKRPFFLEGFDLFDTPLQVAYTRTITAPKWGIRSTGKFGDSAYTVLATGDSGGGLTIIPGALGSDFAPQDFKSTAVIGRVRHDIGSSFVGAVLTDREIRGGGHNRVIGPDGQWRPNDTDSFTAQLLISDTTNPDRPDLSSAFDGRRLTSHALSLSWNHTARKVDGGVNVFDIGNDFRADLGFMPQVGYREYDAVAGLRFYPNNHIFRFVRPSVLVVHQDDSSGRSILQYTSFGVNGFGIKNLQFFIGFRPHEQDFVGNSLLAQSYANWTVQIDPGRRFSRIALQGRTGQQIDFANGRTGTGTDLTLTSTLRPYDRVSFDLTAEHQWLNANGARVFAANVERIRTLYSFSASSILRVIGQYVTTERNPSNYLFSVPRHSGNFLGSVLYSYKLNWQTVLFLGYGDDRVLTPQNDLLRSDRSLFFKVSYALQR